MRTFCARAGSSEAGFTLIELMVNLPIAAALLATVVAFLIGTQRSWDQSQANLTSTQSTRASIQMITRDLQMAGSGFGGQPVNTGGVEGGMLYALETGICSSCPDTLKVAAGVSGDPTTNSAWMESPMDPLVVADIENFSIGDLVLVTNGVEANLFEVTGINEAGSILEHDLTSLHNLPGGHEVWPVGGYSAGATVLCVERISYWIEETSHGRRLVRQSNGNDPVPVVYGIQDMNIEYQLADGTVSADPLNPALIRSVMIEIIPEDGSGEGRPFNIRVKPRVLGG